jgi:putative SOS response-associated peptidase YedK
MCGRLVAGDLNWREYTSMLRLANMPVEEAMQRSFNLAPSQQVAVIRVANRERECVRMRWGLIPAFANGIAGKYNTINCRIESMESSPAYRTAWRRGQRCIFIASGFYEWHDNEDGTRQPYYIRPSDPDEGCAFMIAGLWDSSTTAEGVEILSCTMITMPANALMAEIHNDKQRMPAILEAEDVGTWLTGSSDAARQVLKQYPSELMMAWQVSKAVNAAKNNKPELLLKIA